MGIKIITDSASDISQADAKQLGISVLPLTIRFGTEEFLDGVNLTPAQFFRRLEGGTVFPQTSQITPYIYKLVFSEAVAKGDDVVCFCLSSGVSGSYQSACFAAGEFGNRVYVLDTRQFCVSERIIVERAVQLRDAGFTIAELVGIISAEMRRAHVFAAFDTLEYLKRGGRLSAAGAAVGGLLNIKPVLTITDGVVDVLAKARGAKKACEMLLAEIAKAGEPDFSRPVCFGSTGDTDELLQQFMARFREEYTYTAPARKVPVGATIGAYAGPGAIAVAFFTK
ncbi:MAG: DegV family protein [Eggerthellaceae bacterium]|nr:DegV family protein [Eggerthellaceae bacterium]